MGVQLNCVKLDVLQRYTQQHSVMYRGEIEREKQVEAVKDLVRKHKKVRERAVVNRGRIQFIVSPSISFSTLIHTRHLSLMPPQFPVSPKTFHYNFAHFKRPLG